MELGSNTSLWCVCEGTENLKTFKKQLKNLSYNKSMHGSLKVFTVLLATVKWEQIGMHKKIRMPVTGTSDLKRIKLRYKEHRLVDLSFWGNYGSSYLG